MSEISLREDETELVGSWVERDGVQQDDDNTRRIYRLMKNELKKLASAGGGWEALYVDPADGRLWELTYPFGSRRGGGPPTLLLMDRVAAREKYDVPD